MRAVRVHAPGEIADLRLDDVVTPQPRAGEALVRVHAAAITRDELDWVSDRLPAIPSYELSGVVAEDAAGRRAGDEVFALTPSTVTAWQPSSHWCRVATLMASRYVRRAGPNRLAPGRHHVVTGDHAGRYGPGG